MKRSGGELWEMQTGPLADGGSSGGSHGSSSLRDLDHGEHIYQPKWHKLLDAVAHALVSRLQKTSGKSLEQRDGGLAPHAFICEVGDIDGFTTCSKREARVQVIDILRPFIDALDLNEKDTGAVIIGLHFFMQREGLPTAPYTWRMLSIASILATLQLMFRSSHKARDAREKLLASIEPWCTEPRATAACDALTDWLPPADMINHFKSEGLRCRKREGSSSADTGSSGTIQSCSVEAARLEIASSSSQQGNLHQQTLAPLGRPDDSDDCGVASI